MYFKILMQELKLTLNYFLTSLKVPLIIVSDCPIGRQGLEISLPLFLAPLYKPNSAFQANNGFSLQKMQLLLGFLTELD